MPAHVICLPMLCDSTRHTHQNHTYMPSAFLLLYTHMSLGFESRRSSLFSDVTQYRLVDYDVSEQHIRPMFKGFLLDCLSLEDGTDRLHRNVDNYLQITLRDVEEG